MLHSAFLPCTPLPLTPISLKFRPHLSLTPIRARPISPRKPSPTLSLSLPPASSLLSRAKSDTSLLLSTVSRAASLAALVALLTLPLDSALAAPSGGRVGGRSFRSAPRSAPTRVAPSGSYGGGGGYGYGGGYYGGYAPSGLFFNPFIMPIGLGGFGFGGFGTLVLFAGVAALAAGSRREVLEDDGVVQEVVGIVTLKVGMLGSARELREGLERIGRSANTGTDEGLREVLGETCLSLLRHPEFWVYGSVNVESGRGEKAEGVFERACLAERMRVGEESLKNVGGKVVGGGEDIGGSSEGFVVVSLVVAAEGGVIGRVPKVIDGASGLERGLKGLGGVGMGELRGVEVVWMPRGGEVLNEREMLEIHPELRRL